MLENGRYSANTEAFSLTIEGPEAPTLDHLVTDLWGAMEEDRFEVETPRVHADQTTFQRVDVSKTSGPKVIGQLATQPGPPMLEVTLEWSGDIDLYADFYSHCNYEHAIALYGDMHVWNVELPEDFNIEQTACPGDEMACKARIGWREFAVAGWR